MKQKLGSVLLIDDDQPTNFLHELLIKRAGIAEKVVSLRGGSDALEYLQKTALSPDLILVDINMPEMDGWEFMKKYEKWRKNIVQEGKPVILMLSTSLDPEDFNRALKLKSVTGFKHKPLNESGINEIIKQYFHDKILQRDTNSLINH